MVDLHFCAHCGDVCKGQYCPICGIEARRADKLNAAMAAFVTVAVAALVAAAKEKNRAKGYIAPD